MKMNLFNFQGGTIKLMVKSLGIDLEEDKGDVIGLDVQDKVTMSSFIINFKQTYIDSGMIFLFEGYGRYHTRHACHLWKFWGEK